MEPCVREPSGPQPPRRFLPCPCNTSEGHPWGLHNGEARVLAWPARVSPSLFPISRSLSPEHSNGKNLRHM